MRALFSILLLLAAATVQAAHVQFQWSQFNLQSNLLTNRIFFITPMSAPAGSGNNVISGDRRPYTNDVSATATASNMVVGAYKVDLTGPYAQTTFLICVPDTNALIQASTIICSPTNLPTPGTMAFSSSASDMRYVRHTNGILVSPTNFFTGNVTAGDNIVIEQVGYGVRISSTGGGSSPSTGTSTNIFSTTNTNPNGWVTAVRPALFYSSVDGSMWTKTNTTTDDSGWAGLLGWDPSAPVGPGGSGGGGSGDEGTGLFASTAADPNGSILALRPAVYYNYSSGGLWIKTGTGLNTLGWSMALVP